mmetsp:Transcript_66841/g.169538  ORF Transcript_66841/g.169538 Transcript_66841/m.169538 type:complete len:636 (-) Transcript_66841:52-1959(-)
MDRVVVLSKHVVAPEVVVGCVRACPCSGVPQVDQKLPQQQPKPHPGQSATQRFRQLQWEYSKSAHRLRTEGELPSMTVYELALVAPGRGFPEPFLDKLLSDAEADGSLAALDLLPGPWRSAQTRGEKLRLLQIDQAANERGDHLQLYAGYQQRYGDRGLGSNIAVPTLVVHSPLSTAGPEAAAVPSRVSGDIFRVVCRVLVADAGDAERISRMHVRKEPNFGVFFNSVISTVDNEHWRAQRDQLTEAFLPLSTLAEILPVSLARARACAERLASMASFGDGAVDMSDFLLHEAQAQLQLALLGIPEASMDATNADIRRTFMSHPEAQPGRLSEAMRDLLIQARADTSTRLPSDLDGYPVRGPLSRAIQTGGFAPSTDYGNMLLILFAGHDTTGHTMTWLLFELARHPELQQDVHKEVDAFFEALGGRDPKYQDLSRFDLLDRCVTETLRLWPAVANGTFRQLQFQDEVVGANDSTVTLPKGTLVNIANWSRHRNPQLWGGDAEEFNPRRDFSSGELARVGCPTAARNPQSNRFSPFAHNPRSCLGKNFAQMEMRLILSYLLHNFGFSLAPPYDTVKDVMLPVARSLDGGGPAFYGVNRGGTMGPLDLERRHPDGRPLVALKLRVARRHMGGAVVA